MLFQTYGDRRNPAVLFFHAMGVTGASSEPVAKYLQDRYFCILPTSTVYCEGQKYVSKQDEIRQVEDFLHRQGVERLAMVVASSIGADLAMAFLTQTKLPVGHAFFDGGQFAQIGKGTRRIMTPFLYFAIKSLYWSKGGTLKKILWCDDDSIKPYFIAAGKNLTYTDLRRQISDSLEDKAFSSLPEELQRHIYFEFGSMLLKNFISLHRVVFCAVRTIWRSSLAPGRALLYLRKPKTLEYQGFQVKRKCTVILSKLPCIGGCGGGIRTPGILLPNGPMKAISAKNSFFRPFPLGKPRSSALPNPLFPSAPKR